VITQTVNSAREFKRVNVDWVTAVPIQWEMIRIKHGFRTIGSGTTPPSNEELYYGGSIPWVNTSELRENIITHTERSVTNEAVREFSALRVYPKNSILLAMYGATIGRVAVLGVNATVNQAVCVMADPERFSVSYVFYGLQASRSILDSIATGGGQPNLNAEKVKDHTLPCPPIEEQSAIADYLDRETTHIDTLIAEKERLLALLEAKRTALISRAVTSGINPNVLIKASGQQWLGTIPDHWEIMPIKYLATVGNGSTPLVDNEDYWDDDGFPWMNSSVVNSMVVDIPSRYVTEKALRECHLPMVAPPAVLVGITGQGKTRGMAALLNIETTINQHLAFIKPRDNRISAGYLCHALGHAYEFLRSDSDGAGSTKGAITCEQLANLRIPVPPSDEQCDICTLIEKEVAASVTLIKQVNRSVELLTERRAALITAAVTGQIPIDEMTA
jgi:type I restriction enzyme, S subunit